MIGSVRLITETDIIKEINSGKYDIVAHGCNCFHTMGSGVAKLLNLYTGGRLLEADKNTSWGDINKLGSYSSTTFNSIEFYNLYTQFTYGRDHHVTYVHWESFIDAFIGMVDDMQGKNVLIPLIGCGLANGKFDDLYDRVVTVLKFYDISVTMVTNAREDQIK